MDNIIKYFKYAIGFPIVVAILVTVVIISYLMDDNYKVIYGDFFATCGNNYKYEVKEGEFFWPTPGYTKISSYFGKRHSPTVGASSNHKGIDILAYQGSNICATEDGIVSFAGWDKSGGYMVKIKHEGDITSLYCHMSETINVQTGEMVSKGEVIGTVGPKYLSNGKLNGATTGVHLHFGITRNGRYIDPMEIFYTKQYT